MAGITKDSWQGSVDMFIWKLGSILKDIFIYTRLFEDYANKWHVPFPLDSLAQ